MKLNNSTRERLGTYAQSVPQISAAGTIWPNGEFSLGYSRLGQETDSEHEASWTQPERAISGEEMDARLEAAREMAEAAATAWSMHAQAGILPLTLSNVWNSDRPPTPTKNGLKGLTGYGTKMLRSGCFLLEERLGTDDCVMITLTVPTIGRDARRRLAQRWGVLTNDLVRYLTRRLVSKGRPPAIVGCVEIQTGRLEKYRQGYLHLHLVCPAHSNTGGTWAIDASDLRTWWKSAIERIIGCELPILPRVETAIVEKSVEAYLGKYLSKGTGDELAAFIGDLGEEAVPGQWWFMSARMREAVKSGTAVGRNVGAILDAMVNHLLEVGTGEGFEYIRHIDCEMNGRRITVGYIGRLSPALRDELLAFCKS